jgi:hypothetical protein
MTRTREPFITRSLREAARNERNLRACVRGGFPPSKPQKALDLQGERWPGNRRSTACHAEGRGFESLRPLLQRPSNKSEGFSVPRRPEPAPGIARPLPREWFASRSGRGSVRQRCRDASLTAPTEPALGAGSVMNVLLAATKRAVPACPHGRSGSSPARMPEWLPACTTRRLRY